jgi:hypothetical protein
MVNRLVAIFVVGLLFIPVFSSSGVASMGAPCENGEVDTVAWENSHPDIKVVYKFQFTEAKNRYCVKVANKGGNEWGSSFTALVDGMSVSRKMPMLQPGETVTVTKNITSNLDATRKTHSLVIGAYDNETRYNFTQRSTVDNPTIPSPQVSDVEVLRYESNDSTALRVETFNPSKRGYGLTVQVETFGTDGKFEIAAPQPNETSTVILPLDESSAEVVAGKVRIFGEFGQPETRFDQKEFMSESGEGTNYWDIEFERVPGKVDTDSYSNETARVEYQGYDEDMLSPLQKQLGAVGTVLLVVGAVWWRHRRKYR